MKLQKLILVVVVLLSIVLPAGCSFEEGLRAGVSDGVSAAVSAIIQTPVTFALDQRFQEEGGE